MLRWFDWTARITFVVIAGIMVWRVWVWLTPDAPRTWLRTDLVSAQEGDTFFTGFASLGVVQFSTSSGFKSLAYVRDTRNLANVRGYCYRLYDISIGYPSLRAAVESAEAASGEDLKLPEPQLLSANVVDARSGGEDVSTSQCDEQDHVHAGRSNAARLAGLQQAFAENGQWEAQREHGQLVLTSFSGKLRELREKAIRTRVQDLTERSQALAQVKDERTLDEWVESTAAQLQVANPEAAQAAPLQSAELRAALTGSAASGAGELRAPLPFPGRKEQLSASLREEIDAQRADLARSGGYIGVLKLTFATIGIFSQETGRWFWKNEHFYIRQDLADATYGTDFARHVALERGGFFSPRRLVISVPEPRLLALDRYSTLSVTKGAKPFTLKNDASGTNVEAAMRSDLDVFMQRVTPQAVRFARSALTAQLLDMAGADVADIEVRFVSDEPAAPSQLAELVRLMQQQRQDEERRAREEN